MPMLDVAIAGAGVCGLRLAGLLRGSGLRVAVFEARERLGGRVRTTDSGLDLGPTWYWPRTQPRMARLVADLGLASFDQHDDGRVLRLSDPNRAPETADAPDLHGGARRVSGGMARLVEALSARLAEPLVSLNCRLLAVRDAGPHLELRLRDGDTERMVTARQLMLALPPRLIAEAIRFEPALPPALLSALRCAPTWMATAAKATMRYEHAFWRDAGHSGNAFVSHEQAMLCEVFDACDDITGQAALAGFSELGPAQRRVFRAGLPLMIRSQFAQLFGPQAESGGLHWQDWAEDDLSCSALDRDTPVTEHPGYGDVQLAAAHWNGRLHIGGSESALHGGGYLEGALDAAERTAARLYASAPATDVPGNENRLAVFRGFTQIARGEALARYRAEVHRRLSGQDAAELTQRALLTVVGRVYEDALARIDDLRFDTAELAVERGRSALTPLLLAPFMGFSDSLLDEATAFNRTSCALSNFPPEHQPDREYLGAIRRDLAAAWRDFALRANARMLPCPAPSTPQGA